MLEKRTMERAIVLAAGTGSRLVSGEIAPKPLKPVAGVPLLVRILRTLRAEGIREVVVVTGYKEELIQRALAAESSLGLSISFVSNTQYERKNGVSLLAAREHVVPGTLLTMADHLYSPAIVRRLSALDLPSRAAALAVDYDIPRCFDLDDATKVRVERGRIVDIGKEIAAYDALDTGVFRIGPSLVEALDRVYAAKGDCSLSEGVRALADEGMFFACDAGDARWIDVDTPAALEQAELLLARFGDGLDRDALRIDPRPADRVAPLSRSWAAGYQPAADAE
ncbi:NTP transferase domain-containing protein [Polyangium spumosum]|nr:NTP transferase domain-containing protein [Polyangium spumosum]